MGKLPPTFQRVLRAAAVVCFAVALLLTAGDLSGGDAQAWELGGLLSLAASFL